MQITLIERIVDRCDNAASRDYHKITQATGKVIDTYVSNYIPRIGEVILIEQAYAYDVVSVVHMRGVCIGDFEEPDEDIAEIIVEVKPHVSKNTFDAGGYSVEEDWPLITELEYDFHSLFNTEDDTEE